MTPIVLSNLRKTFGSVAAVDGIDLTIPAGELFFLLGPSGCGKTTLLRMIAGFVDPTAGSIAFGQRDVTHLPPNQRNTGMVFQGYALWPHMTVRQNVAFGLEVRKRPRAEINQRVDEALDSVQLTIQADRRINQLSGGQQQRVALARALVIKPTVLLLDEPLSNLDARLRIEMRQSIRQICKSAGITAVYVTHDQKEALSMADRIALMAAGKVVQVGPPAELYHRPANRFVADFLGETNFIAATVRGYETLIDGKKIALLDTPLGLLRSATLPTDKPAVGASVVCAIRPEALQLHQVDADNHASSVTAANLLKLTRQDSVFLGEMAQHQLLGDGGVVLKAYELHPQGRAEAGAAVTVQIATSDVVMLTEENNQTPPLAV